MTDAAVMSEKRGERGVRDRRTGIVVSDARHKTIKVRYDYLVKHPKYGKFQRRATYLHAHDEANESRKGDVVEVTACRRLSKTKCWRLTRVVRRTKES